MPPQLAWHAGVRGPESVFVWPPCGLAFHFGCVAHMRVSQAWASQFPKRRLSTTRTGPHLALINDSRAHSDDASGRNIRCCNMLRGAWAAAAATARTAVAKPRTCTAATGNPNRLSRTQHVQGVATHGFPGLSQPSGLNHEVPLADDAHEPGATIDLMAIAMPLSQSGPARSAGPHHVTHIGAAHAAEQNAWSDTASLRRSWEGARSSSGRGSGKNCSNTRGTVPPPPPDPPDQALGELSAAARALAAASLAPGTHDTLRELRHPERRPQVQQTPIPAKVLTTEPESPTQLSLEMFVGNLHRARRGAAALHQ